MKADAADFFFVFFFFCFRIGKDKNVKKSYLSDKTLHRLPNKVKGYSKDRSSRLQMFCKIGVLRKSANFTGKNLCSLFNKVRDSSAIVFLQIFAKL